MTTTIPWSNSALTTPACCCWCDAPLMLDGRAAWCSGGVVCRERQMAHGITRTVDGVTSWVFLPTPKQVECISATERNVFVYGSRGGGKSVAFRFWAHAMASANPGFKYAILRTSFPELMKNHLVYLRDEMENVFGGRYHSTDHICYYPNGSIGYYAQCATDEDVKKILGAEVALVIFDEAPTFEWDHMRLITASVRVPEGSKFKPMVRYLGNPIGNSIDELWRYFIDRDVDLDDDPEYREGDWRAIEIHLKDNPHLNREEYRKQFSGLKKHYVKAWLDGERVEERTLFTLIPTKGGKPYHVIPEMPTYNDEPIIRTEFTPEGVVYHALPWVKIYRSYDHGFFPDPAYCLWFAVFGRQVLCFKERWWFETVAEDIAKEIVEESKGLKVVTTYCDPSINVQTGVDTETTMGKMERNGVIMDTSTNNRALYADAIHSMLGSESKPVEIAPGIPRMLFLARGCPQLIKNIPKMKWDEHDPAKMAEHKQDHGPIAFAYFASTQIPTTSPKTTSPVMPWQLPKKTLFNKKRKYGRI